LVEKPGPELGKVEFEVGRALIESGDLDSDIAESFETRGGSGPE
jgi:hypothetical protein